MATIRQRKWSKIIAVSGDLRLDEGTWSAKALPPVQDDEVTPAQLRPVHTGGSWCNPPSSTKQCLIRPYLEPNHIVHAQV